LTGGECVIENVKGRNGLIYASEAITQRVLKDGDFIRIDDGIETTPKGVLMMFSRDRYSNAWSSIPLTNKAEITIGRDPRCNIYLDHVSISRLHAKIVSDGKYFYLIDNGSKNGVMINGKRVSGKVRLYEKDLILITNSKLIFSCNQIFFSCQKNGISVEALRITKKVDNGKKVICNGVDIYIEPCEMVAIVGGSGAGKTTVMNCLSGYSQPTHGNVSVNGVDLYENFDTMKNIIGYVPQSDIVYDNLSVFDMLKYAAQLRLPKDMSAKESRQSIERVIKTVGLTENKDTLIKSLSGGQRKRTSIAVELLSDPNLFFLDEPASGLDPGTERNLMETLRTMAAGGKTVIFVTHSTLNLHLCDKIVFMGRGGNLCFYGSYAEALRFFNVDDIVDVYNMITDESQKWRDMYSSMVVSKGQGITSQAPAKKGSNKDFFKQVSVLCRRHLHILFNDRIRTLLIMLQAPLLAFLISLVADGYQYESYDISKGLLFALSCAAFWIGMLNSIQEVCKERNILKREYMTVLRLDTYILSKITVLSIICFIQTFLLASVFALTVGLPSEGVWLSPFLELLISAFLTALAASAMGIFVSSLFKSPDGAMTVAPLLLMPQLLFSGMLFELEGISNIFSYFAVCRWSMEGLGTTANLNAMDIVMTDGTRIPALAREAEAFFEFTTSHLISSWGVLCIFVVVFSVASVFVLRNINKERA